MNKLKAYAIVTGSYWAFMLTDGALRMLVLLYFNRLGYSPVTLAFLFLFYEIFGIITNLMGGWLAQSKGLKYTLILGLMIQPVALVSLSFMQNSWPPLFAIPFVMVIQAFSGIGKDLTKMSSKTAVKFLVPADRSSSLFKWVSVLTGSKNTIKGLGFFVGGFLLQSVGFRHGLWILAGLIVIVLILSLTSLPENIGETKNKMDFRKLFDIGDKLKLLSGARVFLFASRDIWFVVALPVYFTASFGWSHAEVGGFMALWVIGYGIIQGSAPVLLKFWTKGKAPAGTTAANVSLLLATVMIVLSLLFAFSIGPAPTITIGLIVFGLVFALNSSVHSFLVLDYAHGDKAAADVGFYYMANATGRLIGTLMSGLLFQFGGILWALAGSAVFLIVSYLITRKLK
ncbi:MAG: organoarsenical effux MFS transporter ArsJ [Spirochaetales bacterium]|nr:organoarsenical effux MFS transporter ArsJ [Spirochaetales bacterium]